MRRLLFILLNVFIADAVSVYAQTETTVSFLRRTRQASMYNPAFVSPYATSIGIPIPVLGNINLNVNLRGIDINSVLGSKDGNTLDLNKLSNEINTASFGVNQFLGLDILNVQVPIKNYQVGINLTTRVSNFIEIDKTFFDFVAKGNSAFLGQSVDIRGLDVNSLAYAELGVSVAREFERFSVGARFKYLSGAGYLSSTDLKANYTIGATAPFETRVKVGGTVRAAGLVPVLLDTIDGQAVNSDEKNFDLGADKLTDNRGYAVDLGMTYWITPRLMVHGSILDLGFINWQSNAYQYRFKEVDVQFGGFSIEQIEDSDFRQRYLDSLGALFETAKGSKEGFTAWLPARFTFGADYELTLRDKVGVLLQGQYVAAQWRPAFTLAYSRQVGTNWDLTANYSYFNGSFNNLGFGTAVKWGAAQIYFVQDNLLFYFFPESARNVSLRLGVNLVWGAPNARRPRIH